MAVTEGAPRVAAGLAAASVPLHAWMLVAHPHGIALAVLLGAMSLWCLWCAAGVFRPSGAVAARGGPAACPRSRSLWHLWVMAAGMALLHVALLTGFPGGGGHAAHAVHGATGPETGVSAGTSLMLAVVVVELAVCFACATALRRRHASTTAPRIPTASLTELGSN